MKHHEYLEEPTLLEFPFCTSLLMEILIGVSSSAGLHYLSFFSTIIAVPFLKTLLR